MLAGRGTVAFGASTFAAGLTSGDIDREGELEGLGAGTTFSSPAPEGKDRVPSSSMGARHFLQWITATRPATRSFHKRAGMLNFALQAVHATGNDIGFFEGAGLAPVTALEPEPLALETKVFSGAHCAPVKRAWTRVPAGLLDSTLLPRQFRDQSVSFTR